jgi:hypothetical protein
VNACPGLSHGHGEPFYELLLTFKGEITMSAQDQKFRKYQERLVPLDDSRVELQILMGGSLVARFEGTYKKEEWENDPAWRQSKNMSEGDPLEPGQAPDPSLIEKQREAKIMPGVAKTPDGEEWQRTHPGGMTEREARKAEKRRRETEENK